MSRVTWPGFSGEPARQRVLWAALVAVGDEVGASGLTYPLLPGDGNSAPNITAAQ
jgi:hypothetical protein